MAMGYGGHKRPKTGPTPPPKKNPSTADRARQRVGQVAAAKKKAIEEVRRANAAAQGGNPSAARKARIARQAAADRVHQLAAGERQWRDKAKRMGWKDDELPAATGRRRAGKVTPPPAADKTPPAAGQGTGGSGGSGTGSSGSGGSGRRTPPKAPARPPSYASDKKNAKKNTVLAKALAHKSEPGASGIDLAKFKKRYFSKAGGGHSASRNLSDKSLLALATYLKDKGHKRWGLDPGSSPF